MEFPSLQVEERHHEFRFGPDDVRTFSRIATETDPRSFGEKLTFRKVTPLRPDWTLSPDRLGFTCGAGVTGTGALWTRPVAIPADIPVRGAFFNLLERREVVGGAAGEQSIVVHVRAQPDVGEGSEDVAHRVVPLHAEDDDSETAWHGHFVDFTDLIPHARTHPLHVTLELQTSCTRAPRTGSRCAFDYRELALALAVGSPAETVASARPTRVVERA